MKAISFNIFRFRSYSMFFYMKATMPVRQICNSSGHPICEVHQCCGVGVTHNVYYKTLFFGIGRIEIQFNYQPKGYVPHWADIEPDLSNVVSFNLFKGKRCKK